MIVTVLAFGVLRENKRNTKKYSKDSYINDEATQGTFNAFDLEKTPTNRIDYIFMSKSLKVKEFKINHRKIEERYPSNHYSVQATIKL